MEFFKQAYTSLDYGFPEQFSAYCSDCDEEITGNDPMFIEWDGDVDDEGRAYDCSTRLCRACGEKRGLES